MSGKAKAFLAVLILAAAGAAAAYYFTVLWPGPPEQKGAPEKEKIRWEVERAKLKKEIVDLQDEIALHREEIVPGERLEEVFGKDAADLARADTVRTCQGMDRQILTFFSYLDRQPYIRQAGLEAGAYAQYLRIVDALSRNPPLILEETKDNYSLVRNVAHFFRVLGKENVLLIRRTLAEEPEILEPLAALFYDWTVSADRCKEGIQGRASPETLYEYTAFFLNTLAGRSYLLRRDARVRTLTTYYCILTLDLANRKTLNRYGVDIRPFIDSTIQDIRNMRGLLFAKHYLDTLEELKREYALR